MLDLLVLLYAIEIGLNPGPVVYSNHTMTEETVYYVQLEAAVEFASLLEVGGEVKTHVLKSPTDHTFNPFLADYWFYTQLNLGPITAGYRHLCIHPVVNAYAVPDFSQYRDEFFIRIESTK